MWKSGDNIPWFWCFPAIYLKFRFKSCFFLDQLLRNSLEWPAVQAPCQLPQSRHGIGLQVKVEILHRTGIPRILGMKGLLLHSPQNNLANRSRKKESSASSARQVMSACIKLGFLNLRKTGQLVDVVDLLPSKKSWKPADWYLVSNVSNGPFKSYAAFCSNYSIGLPFIIFDLWNLVPLRGRIKKKTRSP